MSGIRRLKSPFSKNGIFAPIIRVRMNFASNSLFYISSFYIWLDPYCFDQEGGQVEDRGDAERGPHPIVRSCDAGSRYVPQQREYLLPSTDCQCTRDPTAQGRTQGRPMVSFLDLNSIAHEPLGKTIFAAPALSRTWRRERSSKSLSG